MIVATIEQVIQRNMQVKKKIMEFSQTRYINHMVREQRRDSVQW